MVFVNNKKFACESCIKGHRSSSCHHADRPLFEIKKKGRPVSQCEKCRELRQSRRVHSKCNCPQDEPPSRGLLLPSSSMKSRRYIPIVPTLPNGLRDVLPVSPRSPVPPDSRQRVDSLLNPCNCRSVWKCKCRVPNSSLSSRPTAEARAESGLATLAQAAALCCSAGPTPSTAIPKKANSSKRQTSRPNSPNHASHKRPKHINIERSQGPDLPPILYDESSPSPSIPTFATMPPMSTITSLAGSGCTCGVECACPGCVEHRGPEHAAKDRPSCADGCGTCVDAHAGLALPGYEAASTSSITTSIIDQFLARAAALPAPPSNRKMGVGVDLDPMNIMVYPSAAIDSQQRGVPFGLVNLPKLECCGGRCACPEGSCNCRKSCDGSCSEHRANKARPSASPAKCCAG
ncbi:hypothetical protein B0H19DRAFT_697849 [Mycena capillaripes]|nr:hypothetical protein B0H19DRAFT_697849 [Mycena capillaripes]